MSSNKTVFVNARIFTADPKRPWAEALVTEGETIVFVGSNSGALAYQSSHTRKIDLNNRLVLPGFHDAHLHFAEGGFGRIWLNLRAAHSLREFVGAIADFLSAVPEGEWVTSWGWDHENWPEKRYPTRQDVDPVSKNHPLLLQRLDGHVALANSLALKMAGVKRARKIPGGEIQIDPKSGELTGILKDRAIELVTAAIPPISKARRRKAIEAAFEYAARLGVTSVQEMETHPDSFELYREMLDRGEMTARVRAVPLPEHLEALAETGNPRWLVSSGVKLFSDGSLGAGSAWMFEPYADAPTSTGLAIHTESELHRLLEKFDRLGRQICLHAIGDRANHVAVQALCRLAAQNRNARRHRIEHVQVIREKDADAMADCGLVASLQPVHYLDDRRWLTKRIGPQRLPAAYRLRSLIRRKIPVAFGTDWPVEDLNPLQGIYASVSRNIDSWTPQEGISLEEALLAYTRGSAFSEFSESWKGRLLPGFAADFVVLSENLFRISPEEIPQVRVLRTVVGGKTVFEL